MHSVLLADIGATNSRFALKGADGRPERVVKFRGDAVATFEAAIARYLDETGARPQGAVVAIAAPVEGDVVAMTNRAWKFSLRDIAARFGWRAIRAVNDFEAVAMALPRLAPHDVRPLGAAVAEEHAACAVLGPGTGLGVAALVPNGAAWQVVPTEGGHVFFGAACAEEEPIFAALRAECGTVSTEAVLSGPGLERLHRAMHGKAASLSAPDIVAGAHADEPAPRATVEMFVRLFGRFAGDLALLFRALGGVYVGGGVARRIDAFFDAPAFRAAFEHHPPYEHLLRRVPTTMITLDEPGLLGCAALADEMMGGQS